MLLHIGENVSIPLERLLFILNGGGMGAGTRAFVERAKKEHRLMRCAGEAKSYLVVRERGREVIYASPIASATLEKRLRDEINRKYLNEAAVVIVEGL